MNISFESGRKLGFEASVIEVVMPVIIVGLLVFFIGFSIGAVPAVPGSATIPSFSLIFIGVLISVGILTFIGIILFIVAMHRLSQHYHEPSIYTNALYGFILSIIGAIAIVTLEFVFILGATGFFPGIGDVLGPSAAAQLLVGGFAVLAAGFISGIISAVLYMRAFNMLAEKSGNGSFKTAGLLYLIGTVLTIVWIGGLLIWIAWIYAAIGFSSLEQKEPPPPLPIPP